MRFNKFSKSKFEKETGLETVNIIIYHDNQSDPDYREWRPLNLKAYLKNKSDFLYEGLIITEGRTEVFDIRTTKKQIDFFRKIKMLLESKNEDEKIIRVELRKE